MVQGECLGRRGLNWPGAAGAATVSPTLDMSGEGRDKVNKSMGRSRVGLLEEQQQG
jgi:hypothetical protein